MPLTALIAGATGAVGSRTLDALLADDAYGRVLVLARRPLLLSHPKLEQRTVDFTRLIEVQPGHLDVLFCCLGTTIKDAGTQAAFRQVDYTYPLRFAQLGLANGAQHLLLVSGAGANPRASTFYSRTKGELERDLTALGYPALSIFRPSLLLGARLQKRPLERLAQAVLPPLAPLFVGGLRRYRPIASETVARALVIQGRRAQPGTHILHYDEIRALASSAEAL